MARAKLPLAAREDRAAAAAHFAAEGWVQCQDFLEDKAAKALEGHLRRRDDWNQHLNQGEKLFELSRAIRANMTAEKKAALDEAVFRNARQGFQYRFEGLRVDDDPTLWIDDPLHDFARRMNDPETLALLRGLTGAPDIAFADAQATLYSPGDFLTGHDDDVAGKNRRAAYVFSLCPDWRMEWGGLLHLMTGEDRAIALMPGWNRLTLFRVPRVHSVSLVTPAAGQGRLSITGWLRSRP